MINSFTGDYSFLSNMYEVQIEYQGFFFKSSEHLYQGLKIPKSESGGRDAVKNSPHGKVAKKIVENPKCPKIKTDNGDLFRLKQMHTALKCKFEIEEMKILLLKTEDEELIEGNFGNDKFGGVCNNEGNNFLGKLLMKFREDFKRENSK